MLLARVDEAFPLTGAICRATMQIIAFINEACAVQYMGGCGRYETIGLRLPSTQVL